MGMPLGKARVIWDKSRSPTRHVADELRLAHWKVRKAVHDIKNASNLGGNDKIIIYSDGRVTDVNDNEIGNIFDEI